MEDWREKAGRMVSEQILARGTGNERVLRAMENVPRHRFVLSGHERWAYSDCALPVGFGQTISQPYMVARMTDLLLSRRQPATSVLEIGTGSGYQAAVLAEMGISVVSVERIEALAVRARKILDDLGYSVEVVVSDGRYGYAPAAPYCGIIVTAAAEKVEDQWINQLGNGGRLVVPLRVGSGSERLLVRERKETGFSDGWYDYCVFVPVRKGVEPGAEENRT